MKELAEALKHSSRLRIRQGVVTAVDGPTCTVAIGGSSEPVANVPHLNSCAPAAGDVVWMATDNADLWIIGTHGEPPPIDPADLPPLGDYLAASDPEPTPSEPSGLTAAGTFKAIILSWTLPQTALWRTWEVYEGTTADFTPGTPILTTKATVVSVPKASGSGSFYYKVCALNVDGTRSDFAVAGPASVVTISSPDIGAGAVAGPAITAGAVTADKIAAGTITADRLNVADVAAATVTADRINALVLNAVQITGGTITGATVQTAVTGQRVVLGSNVLKFYDAAGALQATAYGTSLDGGGFRVDGDLRVVGDAGFTYSHIGITGAVTISNVGYNGGVALQVYGDLLVDMSLNGGIGSILYAGSLRPTTNWASGTSDDGVWIQDANNSARLKLYYDSSTARLYVRRDASNYAYFSRDGGNI